MKPIITVALFLTSMLCCLGQTLIDTTKFQKEIPTWNGEPDLFYNSAQTKVKQMKLDTLQSGYDSLQIRIWYEYPTSFGKLLVIKCVNSTWTAAEYETNLNWDDSNQTENLSIVNMKQLTPLNGWDKFINELFCLKVMTLPNMRDIPDLEDTWADGVTYNIEVATKKQYRFYGYHVPNEFQDKYWQAKNMVNILKLFETEFGI